MKLIYTYILLFLAMLSILGLAGAFALLASSGAGARAYIEAVRYMSIGGKTALALFLAGTIYFLSKFIFATEKK